MQIDRLFPHKLTLKTTLINIKQGFTLAEALVTLTIIGLLVALTLPTMLSSTEKYDVLYRAAFQLFEKAVDETLNDRSFTPTQNFSNCYKWGIEACPVITGIASKFNTIGEISCNSSTTATPDPTPSYTTSNGMIWWRMGYWGDNTSLLFGTAIPNSQVMLVDVNGKKGPNETGKDRLYILVNYTGKVSPPPQAPENTYVSK
jgi:prepilin-type N-terminal cleavage/methylation domain-containing protein